MCTCWLALIVFNITIIIYILVWLHVSSSVKHLVATNVSNVNINMTTALPNIITINTDEQVMVTGRDPTYEQPSAP